MTLPALFSFLSSLMTLIVPTTREYCWGNFHFWPTLFCSLTILPYSCSRDRTRGVVTTHNSNWSEERTMEAKFSSYFSHIIPYGHPWCSLTPLQGTLDPVHRIRGTQPLCISQCSWQNSEIILWYLVGGTAIARSNVGNPRAPVLVEYQWGSYWIFHIFRSGNKR